MDPHSLVFRSYLEIYCRVRCADIALRPTCPMSSAQSNSNNRMQTEKVKSLRTLGCAWKFSKKGTYCVILFAFSLCLDEHANIFMYEYCKNQIIQ